MNSNKAIGGYFGLEIPTLEQDNYLHGDALLFQSARACLEYILTVKKYKKVYLPQYTCEVVYEPFEKLGIAYEFYKVNKQLEITNIPDVLEGEALLYTNYFGIKNTYAKRLEEILNSKLILDCSQAYYYVNNKQSPTFYSPRKFFGVSDGGVLYIDDSDGGIYNQLRSDKSQQRMGHLLARLEDEPEAAYGLYKRNDESLSHLPMMKMSQITKKILSAIDYDQALSERRRNFLYLHDKLNKYNKLSIDVSSLDGPLCYPLLVIEADLRNYLIGNRVFIPMYWPNIKPSSASEDEVYLATHTIALPIDQRYTIDDMERVVELVKGFLDGS